MARTYNNNNFNNNNNNNNNISITSSVFTLVNTSFHFQVENN